MLEIVALLYAQQENPIMFPSVSKGFLAITAKHEGIVPWPYLDVLGLVTTGVGNLIENRATGEPTENYFEQPWKNASGQLASRAELNEAWHAVKARQDLAHLGGGNPAFAALTSIRLGPPGIGVNQVSPEIEAFVTHVLNSFEAEIKQSIPNFESLYADGQLAMLEHAWAVGPNLGGWPHLRAALTQSPPDYARALVEDHQVGVTEARAQMTRDLWANAAEGQRLGADSSVLIYPTSDLPPFQGGGSDPLGGGGPTLSASLIRGGGKMSTGAKIAVGGGAGLLALGTATYFGWKGLKGLGL